MGEQGFLAAIRDLKPYLYRTARNMLLNHLRKINTEQRALHLRSVSEPGSENPIPALIDSKDYKRLLQEALDQLTEKRKQIFLLRMEENLSLDEIAARLSISRNVVKKQLYTAIAFIREYIHRQGGISAGLLMMLIKNAVIFFLLRVRFASPRVIQYMDQSARTGFIRKFINDSFTSEEHEQFVSWVQQAGKAELEEAWDLFSEMEEANPEHEAPPLAFREALERRLDQVDKPRVFTGSDGMQLHRYW